MFLSGRGRSRIFLWGGGPLEKFGKILKKLEKMGQNLEKIGKNHAKIGQNWPKFFPVGGARAPPAPPLNPSLIERVQKVAFKIILNHSYKSYNNALKTLDQETLYQRRVNICKKFASKNIKSEFSLFEKHPHHPNTRSKPKIAKEFKCNTTRYSKSSLPFLSKLLNTM